MQEQHSFEYAVIRVVPRVEREEFLNVGVILYCRNHKFLQSRIHVNEKKLLSLAETIEMNELQEHLHAFESICNGTGSVSPIAKLDMPSRFRWLTAVRSTVVQTSKVHPGMCIDPMEKLNKLLNQYVS
ncbi:MAG TPA: DUF3037 domain-containing protein [Flavitalea sp.]|nr:DUF3037 domain-containing protein [Flavitalea sp.]